MKNKLRSMLMLQLLDSELDELRELRGDLPDKVNQLEQQVAELKQKIDDCQAAVKTGGEERVRKEKDSLDYLEKIEKYKGQQLQVKTNKEYDALTHQIELAESTIVAYEEEIELFTTEAKDIKLKEEAYSAELEEMNTELEEKKVELEEVLAVTAEEERELEAKRLKTLKEIENDDLEMYARIRGAKGKAVAPVKRGSCSGCYNVVPPQLILEIKKNNRLDICERCGRILVSEELAEETTI